MAGFTNDIMNCTNMDFRGVKPIVGQFISDGQLAIGSSVAPNIRVNTLTPGPGVSIINGNGSIIIGLIGGSSAIQRVSVQTGTTPIVPSGGTITINGAVVAAGTNPVRTNGTGANTLALQVQTSQAIASTDATKIGLSNFNSADFTVDANGFVSIKSAALNYTNVNHAASPYTVLSTDDYISVDTSGGVVSLLFPNVPASNRIWTVKDRTGTAAVSNISITTVGGAVTIDGQTTYTIASNYGSVNILANATPTYEIYSEVYGL